MMPWALLLGGQQENPEGRAKPKKSKFCIQKIDISCTTVTINLLNSVLMMLEIPLQTVMLQMYYDTWLWIFETHITSLLQDAVSV